jgi:uncharacterized protein
MQGIPEIIRLLPFSKKGLTFTHTYKVSDFPRIKALTHNFTGAVRVSLDFYLEKNRIPCIEGQVKLDVALDCQRCLQEVVLPLKPSFKLAFIKNEQQSEELDSSFETILNAEEEFSTKEFLTDEVLISIPMIPMHSHECASYKDSTPINEQKVKNPFEILKTIKNQE